MSIRGLDRHRNAVILLRCLNVAPHGGRRGDWEGLDEDISIAGLLAGSHDQTRHMPSAAE
jgi:hypothetical protein